MYDDFETGRFDLLDKLYANSNDLIHELFHISACYYIMNSNNKDFKNFYSKVSKERRKKYENIQKKFLEDINNGKKRIKNYKEIDLGDSIEIECYGFCIQDFTLFNVLELFIKDNWYDNKKMKVFRENFIKRSKINEEEDENSDENQIQNIHEENKDKKENSKINIEDKNYNNNNNIEKEEGIINKGNNNIKEYENKKNIINNDSKFEKEKIIIAKDNNNNKIKEYAKNKFGYLYFKK